MATFKCAKCNLVMRDEGRMRKHEDGCTTVIDTSPTIWVSGNDETVPVPPPAKMQQ